MIVFQIFQDFYLNDTKVSVTKIHLSCPSPCQPNQENGYLENFEKCRKRKNWSDKLNLFFIFLIIFVRLAWNFWMNLILSPRDIINFQTVILFPHFLSGLSVWIFFSARWNIGHFFSFHENFQQQKNNLKFYLKFISLPMTRV